MNRWAMDRVSASRVVFHCCTHGTLFALLFLHSSCNGSLLCLLYLEYMQGSLSLFLPCFLPASPCNLSWLALGKVEHLFCAWLTWKFDVGAKVGIIRGRASVTLVPRQQRIDLLYLTLCVCVSQAFSLAFLSLFLSLTN